MKFKILFFLKKLCTQNSLSVTNLEKEIKSNMRNIDNITSYKCSQNELSYFNQENHRSHGVENVSVIIVNKKRLNNRKNHNVFIQAQQPRVTSRLSRFSKSKKESSITKPSSMPELNKCTIPVPPRNRSGHRKDTKQYKYKQSPFQSNFIVNVYSEHRFDECLNTRQTKFKIYRCQLDAAEDACCCSCNSDAMFEVMKSLYDCYKKKNCENCNCILCGHLKQEDRRLGEKKKSSVSLLEQENLLRAQAMTGLPLPEGKTASEKKLIEKVRTDLGVPIEPKTKTIRDKHEAAAQDGKLLPLEGKKSAEKEKILQDLHNMGIPLPVGRTPSEKALIAKIMAKTSTLAPSEQMRKAKAEGLLTRLKDKTPEQREKILRAVANRGKPLPEGQSPSEKKLIDKVRADLGLPIEPKNKAIRDKHAKAAKFSLLQPLEGKTPAEKEKILKGQHNLGIPLPVGRTPSEKSLIAKIAVTSRHPSKVASAFQAPSERMRRAKAEGLLTTLKDKTPEHREIILKGLANQGITLPEGQSPSEKKLINKVRANLGLPIEPKTKAIRDKHAKAAKVGLLQPLEGKTPAEKEKILKGLHDLGIPLPKGRTPSEKSLIAKVAAGSRHPSKLASAVLAHSEKMRRAKAEGLLTPLKGKSPEQKEKILKTLAMKGLPLPEDQSPSEKKLIDKVRGDLGLPIEPKTKSIKGKHEQAAKAGLLQPLEGKTPAEKENILKGQHNMGIPLPKGRTPSEKSLIAKIAASSRHPSKVASVFLAPSEQMRRAKAEGLLTPLKDKTPEERGKILRALANRGIPLPGGQSPSEIKLINKVRVDLGLPIEPKTKAIRNKHDQAALAGLLLPLEGKTPAQKEKLLRGQHNMGIPLPVGRTPSEKSLIAKIVAGSPHLSKVASAFLASSEQMRRAKAEGLLTSLKGKTPEKKEKILKALAMKGLALPEGQSPSEKELIDKVRANLGLPREPKTKSIRDKHEQAAKAGLLQPLEGKTPAEQEKILKGQHDMGIPLPEGRTPSEKALIVKVKATSRAISAILAPSEQMRRAKAEGLLATLKDKTPEQREKILRALANRGIPLPGGQTPSEKELIDKIRGDLALPIEPKNKTIRDKHELAAKAGLLQPLEGKTPTQKEKILKGLHNMSIPLPIGRTPSEKSLIAKIAAGSRHPSKVALAFVAHSEQMRRAKAEGLLTPLKDKTPEEREKILRARANRGIPLPEGQSPSEKKLIGKVRADLGLPIEPKTKAVRDKHEKAALAGLLLPLEGKTPTQKEKILRGQHNMGIPLPVGRTPSEKSLIAKVMAGPRPASTSKIPSKAISAILAPSEHMRRAKVEGLLTSLKGKTSEQRENILKALAMRGIPLPNGQTPSVRKLINKVRADLGVPIEPKSNAIRDKHEKAALAGLLFPLEGKTPAQKEKLLRGQHNMGIPLPVGRTPSEKSIIAKIAAGTRYPSKVALAPMAPSEKIRRAKAEGLLTPLKGKTPEQKEKILKALAVTGLPLPEGQSPSEKKLIEKVRVDLGLPVEPTTKSIRDKHEQAAKDGLLQPLEGKTPAEKEKILKGQHDMGIPLPKGRTPSEESLIAKIAASSRLPSKVASAFLVPSEQMRRAKAEGLLTPLKDKTPEEREKILRSLTSRGIPLPEGQSPSEKKLIDKVRADLGLPVEPKTKAIKDKHKKAALAGLLFPLEGKTPAQKEKLLRGQHNMGIPLPVGRTPSEKALIAKIKASSRATSAVLAPSEQMRRAKAEGLLTTLKDKTPEQREKILRGLANRGIPLPESQSPSEKKLINKVRTDLGLPVEPKNKAIRDKHEKAALADLLLPLEGKTPAQKEKLLRGQHNMGIPLPVGRTPSEKSLIAKIMARSRHPSKVASAFLAPSEQMRRAKAEGLLTPLKGKSPEKKEKILKALAMKGLPLPEGQSPSEKKLIEKVRAELGLPIEPKTKGIRDKHEKGALAGLLLPLEGKTPAEKKKLLRGQHNMGIPLPVGRTPSEKSLIAKIASDRRLSSKVTSAILAPSDKMRRAKAEGLLTPLKDKTPEQKERILKGLAVAGSPLPEGQSPSEEKLIDKVRTDLGLPVEPKTKSIRDKHEQAAKAGLLQPLEGKTPAEKEKILKGQHDMDIPLPVGRTPSENSLIAKIAAGSRHPSREPSAFLAPSKQMRRAKAEGLLTPLKDKTTKEREKILRALAMRGKPLPEGQSPSEKKLIDKVRADLGLPIEPKTKAIRDKHEQAARVGKLQPLEGKMSADKEKILQDLHDMGIPLAVGRTASEKALIAKIMAGPRGKSVGMLAAKRLAAGIATEYQDVLKTTTCDRGCGCDKKKIRFKHSYVKIRVTSPDMSSFCDCPGECIPGVKSGAFIDNEGIKVTVGRAVGIPSFTREFLSKTDNSNTHTEHKSLKVSIYSKYKVSRFESGVNDCLNSSSSVERSSTIPNSTESENIYLQSSTPYEGRTSKSDRTVESLRRYQPLDNNYKDLNSKTKSAASSLDSILVIKSEMSLCTTSTSKSMNIVSVMSSMDSSITSNSTHYPSYQFTDNPMSSRSSLDEPTTSDDLIGHPASVGKRKILRSIRGAIPHRQYTILRMSQTKLKVETNNMRVEEPEEAIVLFNHLPSELDVSKIMDKIMSKKRFLDASAIFIAVPMSDDDEERGSHCVDSITRIHSSVTSQEDQNSALRTSSFTEHDEQVCGKGKKFYMQEISSSNETMLNNETLEVLGHFGMPKDEFCQISTQNEIAQMLEKAAQDAGSDTTADRPSNCCHKQYSTPFVIQNCNSSDRYAANVISRQKTPRLLQGNMSGCSRLPDMRTPSTVSSDLPRDVPTCSHSVGSSHFPNMRTPSTISLVLRRDVPTRPSVGPSYFPHKTFGCCHFPDLCTPSTISSVVQCKVSSPCGIDWSCLFPSETYICAGYSPALQTRSTESTGYLCHIPTCSDIRLPLHDSRQHSGRLGHNMHKYSEPASPSKRDRWHSRHKKTHTPCCDCNPSKARNPPMKSMRNEDRTSSTQADYSKKGTSILENLNHTRSSQRRAIRQSYMPNVSATEEVCVCPEIKSSGTITDEITSQQPRHQESQQTRQQTRHQESQQTRHQESRQPRYRVSQQPRHQESQQTRHQESQQPRNHASQQPRHQASQQSKVPKDSSSEENFKCEDIDDADTITDKIRSQQPCRQARPESNTPKDSTSEDIDNAYNITDSDENCILCENIKGTGTIIDEITSQQPRQQASPQFNTPKDFASEDIDDADNIRVSDENCILCEDIKGAGTITNKIRQQPRQQASPQTNTPKDSASEDIDDADTLSGSDENCILCEDINGAGTITNKIKRQQPRQQASPQTNTPKDSASEDIDDADTLSDSDENCILCENIKGAGTIIDEITSQQPRQQASPQSKTPKDFASEDVDNADTITDSDENCILCEDIKNAGTITDAKISQQPRYQTSQQPRHQASQQPHHQASQQSRHQASQQSRHQASQQSRHQASQQSKMRKGSTSEQDCICDDIDYAGTITDEITSQQTDISIHSACKHCCLCEDIDDADTKTDEITSQQPHLQASRKSKKLKYSAVEEDFESKGKEGSDFVSDEIGSRDPCYQATRDPCFQATRKSTILKDFADRKNCEYHQKLKDYTSYEFCVCQDVERRNRLCNPTDQIPHQPAEEISVVLQDQVNTKRSIITKILASIRKSISHKTNKASKYLERSKTSKKEAEKDEDKQMSLKESESHKSNEEKPESLKESEFHKSNEDKPVSLQTSDSHKSNEDKPVSLKKSESRKRRKAKSTVIDPKPVTKSRKSRKAMSTVIAPKLVTKSPKTNEIKEEKVICECNENVFCECSEDKDKPKSQKAEKKPVKPKSHHIVQTVPEPEPQPQQMHAALEVVYDGYPYEHNCGWIDIGELMRLRSELTETTSGFKACKKRKRLIKNVVIIEKPEAEIELDFENAIKYYAGKNLEQFRDLLPRESDQEMYQGKKGKKLLKIKRAKEKKEKEKAKKEKAKKEKALKKGKKNGKDSSEDSDEDEKIRLPKEFCECPYGLTPPELSYEDAKFSAEASEELTKRYPTGMKLCLGGTGVAGTLEGAGVASTLEGASVAETSVSPTGVTA